LPDSLVESDDQRRSALQDAVTRIESRLRRRLRGKLLAAGWFDVDDVVQSARRRLDFMLVHGKCPDLQDGALDAYIHGVAAKITLEKTRKQRRKARLESFLASRCAESLQVANPSDSREALPLILQRLNTVDHHFVELWVRGLSQRVMAERLGVSFEAYRTRRRRLWRTMNSIARGLGLY
jgi:DNA-directed RNA polymerase specialized sigma24 family protein